MYPTRVSRWLLRLSYTWRAAKGSCCVWLSLTADPDIRFKPGYPQGWEKLSNNILRRRPWEMRGIRP